MITINTINNSWYFISSFVIEPNSSAIYDETTLTKLQARDLLLAFDAKRVFMSYVDLELVRAVKNGGNQVPIDNGLPKQDVLVSGDNIKTINGVSLLGSGNIEIVTGSPVDPITSGVTSVNTRDGVVVLTASDVNLGDVDNTSDLDKPISTATVTALNLKYDKGEVDTLLTNYIPITAKGVPLGVATLGPDSKVLPSQIAATVLGDTYVVASEVAQLALSTNKGDIVVRTDLSKSFVKADLSVGLLSGYQELLSPLNPSVDKNSVGLGNVDNTSDLSKPVSTLQQIAIDAKQPLSARLTNITSLSLVENDLLQYKSGVFVARTPVQILDDMNLATVAVTGSYNDLNDKPVTTSSVPVGTIINGLWGLTSFGNLPIPEGYWPLDGTTIVSVGSALNGIVTPDTRGRVLANAKASGGNSGTTAGSEATTIARANLPNVSVTSSGTFTPTGTVSISSTTLDDTYPAASPFNFEGTGSSPNIGRTGNQLDKQRTHSHTATFTGTSSAVSTSFNLNNNVTQTTIDNRQLTYYVTQLVKL